MKPEIKLVDSLFEGVVSISSGRLKKLPNRFAYYRGDGKTKNGNFFDEIVLITDRDLKRVDELPHQHKIAWITEPPSIEPEANEWIQQPENYNKFTMILTYVKDYLDLSNKFVMVPSAGTWIDKSDWNIYAKTKSVSIIASAKDITEGHRLRHEVIKRYRNHITGLYGRGYQSIEYKLQGLWPFRYSIVIENERSPLFFSEKIMDCLLTGTIPIYWGASDIGRFFDMFSILRFETIDELDHIFNEVATEEYYDSRILAIRTNLRKAQQYAIMEDWIYDNVIAKKWASQIKSI